MNNMILLQKKSVRFRDQNNISFFDLNILSKRELSRVNSRFIIQTRLKSYINIDYSEIVIFS